MFKLNDNLEIISCCNKKLQNSILDIFKTIKMICEKHNIRYFAIGGTCIGAVRHKGFIPWDDDLDIAMPNDDYYKFLNIVEKELPKNLSLYKPYDIEYGISVFTKIHNINTTFIEDEEKTYTSVFKGVFVDIMPMYGVPDNGYERKVYAKKIDLFLRFNCKLNRKYKSNINFKSKLLWLVLSPLKLCVKHNFWYKKWCKLVSKYKFDESKYVGYVWSNNIGRLIFPKVWFAQTIDMPFEDTTIKCPIGWHEYLTAQFGDYMRLPPKDMREVVHSGIIDLNKSYKLYQKELGGRK